VHQPSLHIGKAKVEMTPTPGGPPNEMELIGPTLARVGPELCATSSPHAYYLWLCLILDMLKICLDFGPDDAFSSSDVPEMIDQQNLWNSLVISIYLLYLAWNVGMLTVNICILWPPIVPVHVSHNPWLGVGGRLARPHLPPHGKAHQPSEVRQGGGSPENCPGLSPHRHKRAMKNSRGACHKLYKQIFLTWGPTHHVT
jgi:hypothetical protein